ncbi:unnamed protein product [Sympodiomycopsis kandeliae]
MNTVESTDQGHELTDFRRTTVSHTAVRRSDLPPHVESDARALPLENADTETETVPQNQAQGRPADLPSRWAEFALVLISSSGQMLFGMYLGDTVVLQDVIAQQINIQADRAVWIQGAYALAGGLAVIIAGSLADILSPYWMMNSSMAWLVVWNVLGGISLRYGIAAIFFTSRAMQGAAIGTLVSTAISMLGRVYRPGRRKSRAFSIMASTSPIGFSLGTIQGGLLAHHYAWVFWSNAMLNAVLLLLSLHGLPRLKPATPREMNSLGWYQKFDFVGSALALAGCGCLVFGITEGAPSGWAPQSIACCVAGIALLAGFLVLERIVPRPLIPSSLWSIAGFGPLVISYGLNFGAYSAWQFYAVRFFVAVQQVSPLTAALYILPNAVVGFAAATAVSKLFHALAAHWLLIVGMFATAVGPALFLPQTESTSYWALSFPSIAIATLGPDLSFAASSIFVTSSVARHSQGAAGSLLITVQNLGVAIMTGLSDAIQSAAVDDQPVTTRQGTLAGLHALWWFQLGCALAGAAICAFFVRIPRGQEKDHAQ